MIKMKALKTFGFTGANEGAVKRGREFDARDLKRAEELEAHGLAYRLDVKAAKPPLNKMEPAPTNQMELGSSSNKAAEHGPLDSVGGETGAEATAPLSRQGRAPRGRRSPSSADDLLS
jgi:hypothetical protein